MDDFVLKVLGLGKNTQISQPSLALLSLVVFFAHGWQLYILLCILFFKLHIAF